MELKLQHHQIPYRLSGRQPAFFARQEVKDLMVTSACWSTRMTTTPSCG